MRGRVVSLAARGVALGTSVALAQGGVPPVDAYPLPPPPAPADARRAVELSPGLGAVLPLCATGSRSDLACRGVGAGGGLSLLGLWRVTPRFAWGGSLGFAGFRYDPPPEVDFEEPQAGAAWLLFHGRYYFADEGMLDPYLEVGIGGAALGTVGTAADGRRLERTGAGPALQAGGGVDFFISRRIRLGPTLTFTRVFVDKIRQCEAGSSEPCVDLAKGEQGHLNALFFLGLRMTILLGEEL